jgi:hypothetical protein
MPLPRPSVTYAILSIPFFLLCIVDMVWGKTIFIEKALLDRLGFLSDLVFLNNVHVYFSFFLMYKMKEFREIFSGVNLILIAAANSVLVLCLLLFHFNDITLSVVAVFHAFFQSAGIFLLFYCPPQHRKLAKNVMWIAVVILIAKATKIIQLPGELAYLLGSLLFGTVAYMTKNLLGLLFGLRFFLWFAPIELSGFSVGSLHGLEYLFIVIYLFKDNGIRIRPMDIPIAFICLLIPCYYAINRYFFADHLAIAFVYFFGVYLHYMFDSYAFRFRLSKPRQLILPLFSRR